MMISRFIAFLFLIHSVQAKNSVTIRFIQNYIENERKPTDLICVNLGWKKSDLIKMAKVLSSSSVRISTSFPRSKSVSDGRDLFLIDMETSCALSNLTSYFRAPYRWLVLSGETSSDFLWDLPLLLDSEFVLAVRNNDEFTLTELYKPSPNGPTYSQMRGYYNGSLVDSRARREMYRRRRDLRGYELVMSNVIQESNTTMYHLPREDRLELQYDTVPKMAWSVVRLSFEMVNATPKYIFNYRFGYKSNGSWSGMIQDLMTGKAVIGTNILPNLGRLQVVDFTESLSPFEAQFLFRQPPLADVSNIYTLPFSLNVWLAIIACVIVSTIAIYLDVKWEASTVNKTQVDGNITDAILITMGAASVQGSPVMPSTFSGRLMFWMTFLSMMIIYTAYSANIVALLQVPSNSIRTIDQLTKSKITLAAENLDYNKFVLKKDKKIHDRILPEKGKKLLYDLEIGVQKLRREPIAIHCVLGSFYRRIEQTYLETEKCGLTNIDFLNGFDPVAPVTKHTPYKELLKVSLKQIREAGVRAALEQRYRVPKPKCTKTGSAFNSISLQNMRPVFLLAVLGITMSVIILILEVIVHKVTIRQQQRKCMIKMRQKYTCHAR